MRLGVFTPIFGNLSFDAMLAQVARYKALTSIELGTGSWVGSSHVELDGMLASSERAREFSQRIADAGLIISAFSCHGNPVHPVEWTATQEDETFRKTVRLAERLHVPVVVTFSGCPGGGPKDTTPNWITAPWPPEFQEALAWQWEERLIPYWRDAAQFAADHGVKVALEAHPGFCVYNPETLLRLRAATHPALGSNFDPSHLWWQGIDIPAAITALGEAIFHFHAKDVAINPQVVDRHGVLDTKSYRELAKRSWLFRSVGWGHGELEWKAIASALRLVKYDYVMSIEHENALASVDEGLSSAVSFLERIVLREAPAEAWWT